MHVVVDSTACIAAGQCVFTAADLFEQCDEDGTVRLLVASPPPERHQAAREAAMLCPAGAITVVDD